MTEFHRKVAPLLVLFAFALGMAARGQDLFEQEDANDKKAPLTAEQKAAGEKESIF